MTTNERTFPCNPCPRRPSARAPWNRCLGVIFTLAACASSAGLADFAGQWNLDSSRSDRIDQAIETCIAQYPEAAKVSTRQRLKSTNPVSHSMYFTAMDDGGKVLIGYDSPSDGTTAPMDGTEVPTKNSSGESFVMTVRLENAAIVEVFQADNGTRTNTYTVDANGKTLSMKVVVESPYMPTQLVYQLTYSRAGNTSTPKAPKTRKPGSVGPSAFMRRDNFRLVWNARTVGWYRLDGRHSGALTFAESNFGRL